MATSESTGGFDVVLGNPPWERVKLQEKEFFATRDPDIAEARNAAARKRLIQELSKTNPSLADEWHAAQRRAGGESHFVRNSGAHPFGGVGDVNTYAVFADLSRCVLNDCGRAGIILPNGLVTGFTYREFLNHLLMTRTLVSFFGFENEEKLFTEVHNETKFGLLTIAGQKRPVTQIHFTAHIRHPRSINDPARCYSLSLEQIEQINPNTKSIPMFRLAGDAEISAAIHGAAPVLVRKQAHEADESPWGVRFQRMFDMANDSARFLDHVEIAPRIVRRDGSMGLLDDDSQVLPLYEGKMFWHFNHRYGTYEGQTQRQANKGVLPRVPDDHLADPEYQVQPRYWVRASELRPVMREYGERTWLLCWRDVGISERTFILSPIPAVAVGHNAPVIYATGRAMGIVALTALLSSLLLDYDARQKSYRMTYFVVEQIAVLTPDQLLQPVSWMGTSAERWLARRVVELCYTNYELQGLARETGYDGPPFVWNHDRRSLIQAELDAAILHLYGLSRRQCVWVLDSFSVLGKYERRDHGEFRTKRLVLDAFDAIATAIADNCVYRSNLDPLPGPPVDEAGEAIPMARWDDQIWQRYQGIIHRPREERRPAAAAATVGTHAPVGAGGFPDNERDRLLVAAALALVGPDGIDEETHLDAMILIATPERCRTLCANGADVDAAFAAVPEGLEGDSVRWSRVCRYLASEGIDAITRDVHSGRITRGENYADLVEHYPSGLNEVAKVVIEAAHALQSASDDMKREQEQQRQVERNAAA